MPRLSQRRNWTPEVVPELRGTYDGLHVVLREFPCLADPSHGRRKYPYAGFGAEFLTQLADRHLGDFEQIRQVLSAGLRKTVYVKVSDLGAIEVQISGRAPLGAHRFYSDLADALIIAFGSL